MSETTRSAVRPGMADFVPREIVITSRGYETLDGVPRTTIRPMRVEGNRLSTFVESCLVQTGKKQLFEDTEYFEALRQLSAIVRKGTVTPLFARLFADVMVADKEGAGLGLPIFILLSFDAMCESLHLREYRPLTTRK